MALKYLCGSFLALVILVAGASAQAQYFLPAALVTDGVPVHPLCFLKPDNASKERQINLGTCAQKAGYTVRERGIFQPATGFIGTSYSFTNTDSGRVSSGFVEYKFLGKIDEEALILIQEHNSKSGGHTEIYRATRNGDIVTLTSLVSGGDQCRGGIGEAGVTDNSLNYKLYATARGLVSYGHDDKGAAAPYAGLADCVTCCFATLEYQGEELVAVALNKNVAAAGQGPLQECFDSIFREQVETATALTPEEFGDFVSLFKDKCPAEASKEISTPPEEQ